MRLVTFMGGQAALPGVLIDDAVVALSSLGSPATSIRSLLETTTPQERSALSERATAADARVPVAEVELLAPVPDPEKIICLGLNYRDHAEETGQEIPSSPMWFAKFANSLRGSGQDIVLPSAHSEYVDYEAELALVVGRRARNVSPDDALAHLAGAMPFNDVSARDLQLANPLWTSGKAVDSFAPCGPALVTLDEIADLEDLALRTRVNGEVLQSGTTANLIFGPAEIVSWLSRTITLLPGDIIATGTPAGVGAAQGRFLRAGDSVEVEIDSLGRLVNGVTAE